MENPGDLEDVHDDDVDDVEDGSDDVIRRKTRTSDPTQPINLARVLVTHLCTESNRWTHGSSEKCVRYLTELLTVRSTFRHKVTSFIFSFVSSPFLYRNCTHIYVLMFSY